LGYEINAKYLLIYRKMIYVANHKHLKKLILDEYHKIPYVGHTRYKKMIFSLRKEFFWLDMKKDVAKYLARCLEI